MRGRRDRGSSAPVSLFSLQDIITCLTGIMILIVLILAVEAIATPESQGRGVHIDLPSVEELEARFKALQEERDELVSQIGMRNPQADSLSAADKVRATLKLKQQRTDQIRQETALELSQEKQQERLMELLNRKHRRAEELEGLREEMESFNEKAMRATSMVRFLPGEGLDKTPHLLVSDRNGVQVLSLAEPIRDQAWSPALTERGLRRLLTDADTEKEYFVVILKPSGADLGLELYETIRTAGFQAGYDTLEENAWVLPSEVVE